MSPFSGGFSVVLSLVSVVLVLLLCFWCVGCFCVCLFAGVSFVLLVVFGVCFYCLLVVVLFCLFRFFGPGCWCVFVHVSFVCLVCFWFCVVLLCSAFMLVAGGWFMLLLVGVGLFSSPGVGFWCVVFAPGVFCVGSFFGGRLVLVCPLFCSWFMWWLVGPVASGG